MLNDRGFVFDPSSGESFQLNPTGLACLRALQDGATTEEMVSSLVREWDVDEAAARCDLDAFLWDLQQLAWL